MRSILILASVLALASCGKKDDGAGAPPPGAPGGPAPEVTVAHPMVKPIVDWDDYTGRFEAVDSVDVRPRVSGYLQSINFRDGQFAKKGQLLMVIDPRPFQAILEQAKADEARYVAAAAVAQTAFNREKELLDLKAVSQEEYDNSQAALRQAVAQLGSAKANTRAKALDVEFTRVTAPAAGRLSDRKVSAGNYVTSGTTVLTTIVSLNPIHFLFTGSEAVYLKYQRANRAGTRPSSRVAANPVDIRLGDETEYRWHGRMDFVDNALDLGSGTIRGRAVVSNPDGLLTPGMFGHMRLLGSGAYSGMLIPEDAIVTDQTRKAVLVVGADGKAAQRVVVLGPIIDGLRVVRSGLNATDNVVIAGVQRAHPGTPVKIKEGKIVPPDPGSGPAVPTFIEPPSTSATSASSVR
ncbi:MULTISPECIES: efflux RND transporter periplasmic adaptor subunit [Sphingosinicellaceae]|uniref:efflux RND transporter periplasmic adaptor subunit n=1 Tax=Sphingosinicellaceae TaxID=2820280 RepID=UPI001C1E34A5|nr:MULTISPECIES: efflux RND transporter periplasmic adaptor subunit [Polymorphobacter]QYE35175.1 efflux RND transporter periplasmic adaptor subunit [Polymorphobacter sp. PAMC 29334]UAJ11499.1 efflux RND transporter periplasmic adaptor subunit [Polymorphobacter megasporae]